MEYSRKDLNEFISKVSLDFYGKSNVPMDLTYLEDHVNDTIKNRLIDLVQDHLDTQDFDFLVALSLELKLIREDMENEKQLKEARQEKKQSTIQ